MVSRYPSLALLLILSTGYVTVSESSSLLQEVLHGLDKGSQFFSEDYSSINVDGLFGIRNAQGTIIQSLEWCPSNNCPVWLVDHLTRLNITISVTADRAVEYVKAQDEDYFNRFHKVVDTPYIIEASSMTLDESKENSGHKSSYSEPKGDKCLSSLMGSWDFGNKGPCFVDDECLRYMTRADQSKYSITHQFLFFLFAEKNNCISSLNPMLSRLGLGSTHTIRKNLCSHIYAEAESEVKNGTVQQNYQDLFLEQVLMCGLTGFKEFMKPAWVRMVLKWQTWRGCFTRTDKIYLQQLELQQQQSRLMDLLRKEVKDINSQPSVGHRKLLVEKLMQDDCLSHKSGLGIAVLGTFQRHLVYNSNW